MRIAVLSLSVLMLDGPVGAALAGEQDDTRVLRRTPVVEVFEANRDAVVNISSTETVAIRDPFDRLFQDLFDTPFRPRTREYKRTSVGSGFVIHADGYIVTNAHVVARTVERRVKFANGREFDARIVASDRERDLAVLKIDASGLLPTLPFGRSHDLMVGETVIAIGNALGYQHSVTAGVVSATGRNFEFRNEVTLRNLIQTDASINPGNSGGPLLNVLGELIGINTAIRGDAQNIGFAIPVDQLREILPDLLDVERRYRIISGLKLSNLGGLKVVEVAPDSPAARAGIQAGDVLSAIERRPVAESVDFDIALIGRAAGDRLPLTLQRGGRVYETTLRLAGRPAPDAEKLARERLGVELRPLPESLARELGAPGAAGLVIVNVDPGGPGPR
ncbi:MAG: S1C family serine protease [Planctomycetota bacterium]|jgi:serine protease Do